MSQINEEVKEEKNVFLIYIQLALKDKDYQIENVCLICFGDMVEPIFHPDCMHEFCRDCVIQYLEN